MKPNEQIKIQRLRILSELMDSKFEGPMGIRFGLDGILGFIPFVGDIITSLISFGIVVVAAQMGATPSTLVRMSLNILLENLVDMIPVLGSLFDFWWQSNNRNMQILEEHLQNPESVSVTSRVVVLVVIFSVFVVVFLFMYLSWMMLQVFIGLIS